MPNNDRAQRRLNAKRAAKQNRHQLEALRREQAKRERRRFLLVTGVVILVGLIIVGAVAIPAYVRNLHSPSHQALSSYGLSTTAAACDADTVMPAEPGPKEVTTDSERAHLDTIAKTPPYTKWDYTNNPPASGPHFSTPLPDLPHYYPPSTATTEVNLVEQAVHNLEHGFVVVWYDTSIAADAGKLKALEDMGTNLEQRAHFTSYLAVPWPAGRPPMPSGKHIALTSWHSRQLCADVSGQALEAFVNAHPTNCAPEPGGSAQTPQQQASCGQTPTPVPTPSISASVNASTSGSASPTTSTSTSGSPSPSTSSSPTLPTTSATPSSSAS